MKRETMAALLAIAIVLFQPGLADLRAQAQQEGIKVHGHWTIDVRQPDGTLVTHREFENALQPAGAGVLADFLSRRRIPGAWSVELANPHLSDPTGINNPCLNTDLLGATFPYPCQILEGPAGGSGTRSTYQFYSLTLGPTGLVLSGTATAGKAGTIGQVATRFRACESIAVAGPNPTVQDCASVATSVAASGEFSLAIVSPAIGVVAGQLIQVTVTFTFS